MTRAWILGSAVALLAAASALAGEGDGDHGGACCPTVKVETVDDYCWEVRSKEICIPPVRFPWQKKFGGGKGHGDACCAEPVHRCGKIRCVKFLWQKPLVKEQCVYEWNVVHSGKGKYCAPHIETIPAAAGGEVPAAWPAASAHAPVHGREQILAR